MKRQLKSPHMIPFHLQQHSQSMEVKQLIQWFSGNFGGLPFVIPCNFNLTSFPYDNPALLSFLIIKVSHVYVSSFLFPSQNHEFFQNENFIKQLLFSTNPLYARRGVEWMNYTQEWNFTHHISFIFPIFCRWHLNS